MAQPMLEVFVYGIICMRKDRLRVCLDDFPVNVVLIHC